MDPDVLNCADKIAIGVRTLLNGSSGINLLDAAASVFDQRYSGWVLRSSRDKSRTKNCIDTRWLVSPVQFGSGALAMRFEPRR